MHIDSCVQYDYTVGKFEAPRLGKENFVWDVGMWESWSHRYQRSQFTGSRPGALKWTRDVEPMQGLRPALLAMVSLAD